MPLPHLAKAPYLKADHVKNDEVVTVTKKPWIVKADEAVGPFKRDRAYIGIKVDRDDSEYTWGLNVTTYENLLEAFGEDAELWVGKKVKIRKETQTVRGEQREVLFGREYKEPQQHLPANRQDNDQQLTAKLKELTPEQKATLLKSLQNE